MHIGVSYNGSTPVSKTVNAGSIPVTPAISRIQSKYKIFTLFLCRFLTKMVKNSKIHTILKIAKFRLVCIINEKMYYNYNIKMNTLKWERTNSGQ